MTNLPVGLMCQTQFFAIGSESPSAVADIGFDDLADVVGRLLRIGVLGREHDRDSLHRLAVVVAHRDLALRVRRQRLLLAGMARIGQQFENAVAELDRRRHQFRRFVGGVAEHDALVARALFLVARGIDALGDVFGLAVQQHLDLGVAPAETFLIVADVLDRHARVMRDQLLAHRVGATVFAGDDDAVGRRHASRRRSAGSRDRGPASSVVR